MIRFVDDGEIFNEIDEDRNYFLSEAEQVVEQIKVRLTNEKRVSSPKKFECWIDGDKVIVTEVRFENKQSLEEQIKDTILKDDWDDELKHRYINKINDYVVKERELMVHKPFKAFLERFDRYMGSPDLCPFPLLLSIEKSRDLYDGVLVHIETGFYSELEVIMASIHEAYSIVVMDVQDELIQVDHSEYEGSFEDFLKVRVITWLGNEENFIKFKNYVVSHYNSVAKMRIDALYPRFKPFQNIEVDLFMNHLETLGFDFAYELHNELIEQFYVRYNKTLFGGFAIESDDMITSLILSPVVKGFAEVVDKEIAKRNREKKDANEEVHA